MTIGDLSDFQFDVVQETLPARGYGDLSRYASTVCVVFEHGHVHRHIEMAPEHLIRIWKRLEFVAPGAGQQQVRNDCAFCGFERSPRDDNHAPECPYWTVGPGKFTTGPVIPEKRHALDQLLEEDSCQIPGCGCSGQEHR